MSEKYIEMWQNIGIDIEKHNQLLNILGQYFGAVYLTQKNRPKKMDYFDYVISEIHGGRIKELNDQRAAGNKVIGAFCVYAPEEIAYAANASMVGLCGGADFSVPDAEAVLPRNLCPLIKSFYGFRLNRTCPYFQSSDLVVGETTCDGKKKVYELLNELIPTYVIEIPHCPDSQKGKEFWLKEVEAFKTKIEEVTGNKITAEKLKASIELINNKRKALQRLSNLRKSNPSPISGLDALLIYQISFNDDPVRFAAKVNELCDELEERVKNGVGVAPKDAPRLMISGCPMAIPNWKLHSIAQEVGATVVVEESCVGTRYFSKLVEPKGDSLEELLWAIVEKYSKIPCACFTPNDRRISTVTDLAKQFKADGVIYYTLQNCHDYNVEGVKVDRALKALDVPMLKIETDYAMGDAAQIKTRVEAFLEIIQGKKEQ
ncbi:MAG: double-cubane-cluster-containing anaerobic reductase [Candidatus Bathyarchaeota archaeon]|nr:double-cubane-cluster-containing anaerobic reductase [Candidatus Bathyarchaeota archaeon]